MPDDADPGLPLPFLRGEILMAVGFGTTVRRRIGDRAEGAR
jgi:hypothetical protein